MVDCTMKAEKVVWARVLSIELTRYHSARKYRIMQNLDVSFCRLAKGHRRKKKSLMDRQHSNAKPRTISSQ